MRPPPVCVRKGWKGWNTFKGVNHLHAGEMLFTPRKVFRVFQPFQEADR
jgi:hypothetical protein